jgi:hypothetical protein
VAKVLAGRPFVDLRFADLYAESVLPVASGDSLPASFALPLFCCTFPRPLLPLQLLRLLSGDVVLLLYFAGLAGRLTLCPHHSVNFPNPLTSSLA